MCRPLIYSVHDAWLIGSIIISQVQLETKHRVSIVLPTSISASSPGPSSKKVLALIADQEGAYQESLADVYHEMGEKSFKGLRRALPLTRQKLDWDKVRRLGPGPSQKNVVAYL
jgi:F-actin capping protein alpha subunit